MKRIEFSVITVVKNDLRGLKKTRKCLENQKYTNWHHIIIDGGSSASTKNYLKTLPKSNTTYISEDDSGIYHAMNKGWKIASANSYVYYLNARDVFASENSLQDAAKVLAKSNLPEWGCATHEEINSDGSGWVCKLVSQPSIENQLYAFGYRSHQAVLMKQEMLLSLGGFDLRFKIAADWDLIVRAMKISSPVVWKESLGRFELGGYSSNRLLDAHRELRFLRRQYIGRSIRIQILDEIWSMIFLKSLGYTNLIMRLTSRLKLLLNFKLSLNLRRTLVSNLNKFLQLFDLEVVSHTRRKLRRSRKSYRLKNMLRRFKFLIRQKLIEFILNRLKVSKYS
jgi:glycosyltransferase involved in cell wall biosynthesis